MGATLQEDDGLGRSGGLAELWNANVWICSLSQHSLFYSLLGPVLQAKNATTLFNLSGAVASLHCLKQSFVDLEVLCFGC